MNLPNGFLIVLVVILWLIWSGVLAFFLLAVYRVLRLVRREHRQLAPGLVWLGLIPVAGIVIVLAMARPVSVSLRKQFEVLGEADSNDSYGLRPGLMAASGLFLFVGLRCAAQFMGKDAIPPLAPELFGLAGLVAWVVCWTRINLCRLRLQRHFPTAGYSPEEQDYGDDLPPRNEP